MSAASSVGVLHIIIWSSTLLDGDEANVIPGDDTPGGNGNPPNDVEAVDLGLPSGTKWANMNVGAEKLSERCQWL